MCVGQGRGATNGLGPLSSAPSRTLDFVTWQLFPRDPPCPRDGHCPGPPAFSTSPTPCRQDPLVRLLPESGLQAMVTLCPGLRQRALGWRPRMGLTLPANQLRQGQSPRRSSPQRDTTWWAAVHARVRAVITSANFQHPKKKPRSHWQSPLEITDPFLSVDPPVSHTSRRWGHTRQGPCVWLLLCMVFSGSAHAMPRVTFHSAADGVSLRGRCTFLYP